MGAYWGKEEGLTMELGGSFGTSVCMVFGSGFGSGFGFRLVWDFLRLLLLIFGVLIFLKRSFLNL